MRSTSPLKRINTGFLLFLHTLLYGRLFNEYYARHTSRKIKSVFKSKGMSGKHMTGQVPLALVADMLGAIADYSKSD